MRMEKEMDQTRLVEMTVCAASGNIHFTGLPVKEDGPLPHMQILVNPAERKLLLRFSDADEKNAFQPVMVEGQPGSCKLERAGYFIDRLYHMLSWDLFIDYRLTAILSDGGFGACLLFDLTKAEALPYDRELLRGARKIIPREWSERMV